MAKDQVEIKFGPARFDSPKAIRRAIEDTATETEENTINNIVNNPTLNLGGDGGVAGISNVVVATYNATTLTGTGSVAGTSYTFKNGTGSYLAVNDKVFLVIDAAGNYTAVAITERGGAVTPIGQPIAALSPNFPLRTDNLPFPIQPGGNTGAVRLAGDLAYDLAGTAGYGVDTILGWSTASKTALNAFVRSSATSLGLYSNPGVTSAVVVQPSGRVILFAQGATVFYYRNPGAASFTAATLFGATTGQYVYAYDRSTGAFWGLRRAQTPTAPVFTRLLDTDAAPVNAGALGITDPQYTGIATSLVAEKGYLSFLYTNSSGTVGFKTLKASNDSSSFTVQTSTVVTANFTMSFTESLDGAGNCYYFLSSGVTSTYHIRILYGTGVTADFDTGIPTTNNQLFRMAITNSGLAVMTLSMRADAFGGLSTSWIPVLATTDFATTAYSFYDLTTITGATSAAIRTTEPNEVASGTIRFGVFSGTSNRFYIYELTGF